MKKISKAAVFFFVIISVTPGFAADYTISTGPHFDWWESSGDDKGMQFFAPLRITAHQDAFTFTMQTAYAYTSLDLDGTPDRSLTNLIDTKMNFSYELIDRFPLDLMIGLDLNLPTGKTRLELTDLQRMLDPDLVTIHRYGEGFNVNPTFIVGKTWKNFGAGIGLGYVYRGEYDFSDEILDYDPGDIFNVTAEVIYYPSDTWKISLFGEYGHLGTDTVKDDDYFQDGDFYLVELEIMRIATSWDLTLDMTGLFRGKSRFQEGLDNDLSTEEKNSYGDEWVADILFRYHLTDFTSVKTQVQYLYIDENDYGSESPLFWGTRKKISLSIGVVHKLTANLDGEVFVRGFIIDDERNWYHPDNDLTYRGFSSGILLTSRF